MDRLNFLLENLFFHDSKKVECFAWAFFVCALLFVLAPVLFLGSNTFTHDAIFWYPVYQFFAENILQGRFPFWNPYTHGGEPFFYIPWAGFRLLDPTTFMTFLLAGLFKGDLLFLYHWDLTIKCLLAALGVYLVVRRCAEHLITRISLIPILLFSSFTLTNLRQPGLILTFMWAPFIAYFLFEIALHGRGTWRNWIGMGFFVGISMGSYHFSGVCLFLLLVLFALALFHRDVLAKVFKDRRFFRKIGVTSLLVILLAFPTGAAYLEKDKMFTTARSSRVQGWQWEFSDVTSESGTLSNPSFQKANNLRVSYDFIEKTGSHSSFWNILGLLQPYSYIWYCFPVGSSEAFNYLGMLVATVACIGLVAGRHPFKRLWLFLFVCFGLYVLGPAGGIHRLLFTVYPPMQFARHSQNFNHYFVFSLIFFYVLGCNHAIRVFPSALFGQGPDPGMPGSGGRGPLDRFVATFLMLIMVTSVFLMVYPKWFSQKDYLVIGLLFGLSFVLRGYLSPKGLFAAVFLALIISVLALSFNPYTIEAEGSLKSHFMVLVNKGFRLTWLAGAVSFLAIPVAVYFMGRRKASGHRGIVFSLIFIVLMGDLGAYVSIHRSFFWGSPNFTRETPLNSRVSQPRFHHQRYLAPPEVFQSKRQSLRYLSLANRRPYMMNAVYNREPPIPIHSVELALRMKKWNSFMSLPEYARILQSGIRGEVLGELFAVGRPILQFRDNYVHLPDERVMQTLRDADGAKVLGLVRNSVFIHGKPGDDMLGSGLRAAGPEGPVLSVPPPVDREDYRYAVDHFDCNGLRLVVKARKDGILHYSDGYDRHWRATLDGIETPVYRANMNFKAVFVPAGTHRVEFEYVPRTFRFALYVYLVACLGTGLLAVYGCVAWALKRLRKGRPATRGGTVWESP